MQEIGIKNLLPAKDIQKKILAGFIVGIDFLLAVQFPVDKEIHAVMCRLLHPDDVHHGGENSPVERCLQRHPLIQGQKRRTLIRHIHLIKKILRNRRHCRIALRKQFCIRLLFYHIHFGKEFHFPHHVD